MKKSFITSIIAMLSGAFVCMVLAGCENFLKGSDIREDLIEAIEIANSNPVTYYIQTDEGAGALSAGQIRLKRKEKFDIMFTPSSEWKFLRWEVIDRDTKEIVTDSIIFEDATKLEVHGTVVKPRENLCIYAKCFMQPYIVNYFPKTDTPQLTNTMIEITFNMPMEAETTTPSASVFNYNNISITYNNNHIEHYFEAPYFDSAKKILYLQPKPLELKAFIEPNELKKIKISLSENIYVNYENSNLYLINNENCSFNVFYKAEIDDVDPVIDDFYMTRYTDDTIDKKFSDWQGTFQHAEIMQNRVRDKVYIHGKCHDDGSGIKKIVVTEQRKKNPSNEDVIDLIYTEEYSPEKGNVVFVENNGYIDFLIEHNLSSSNGKVLLDTRVFDVCNNSVNKTIYAIVTSDETICDTFAVYNVKDLYMDQTEDGSADFAINRYDNPKTLRIYGQKAPNKPNNSNENYHELYEKIYYRGSSIGWATFQENEYEEKYTITCRYTDKDGNPKDERFLYNSTDHEWSYTLENVDSISGMKVTVVVKDDIGNTLTREISFPYTPVPILTQIENETTRKFFFVRSDVIYRNNTSIQMYRSLSSVHRDISISSTDPSIQFFARTGFLCGEFTEVSYATFDATPSYASDVTIIRVDTSPYPCKNYHDNETAYTNVTVSIADNSWNTYDSIYYETPDKKLWTLEKPLTQFSFMLPTSDCFSESHTFKVYGIINHKKTDGAEGTVPKLEESKDDNCPPFVEWEKTDYYSYKLNVTDNCVSETGSKVASVELITKDGNYISLDRKENYVSYYTNVSVPSWLLEEESIKLGGIHVVYLKATDSNGNSITKAVPISNKLNRDYGKDYQVKKHSEGEWYIENMETGYKILNNQSYLYKYNWNSSSDKWSNTADRKGYTGNSNEYHIGPLANVPANNFIKLILVNKISGDEEGQFEGEVDYPKYIYTGTVTSLEENKYFVRNDSESLFISSDVPVFIHTVATKKSYSECSSWSINEWERYHLQLKEKVFDFSATDRVQKKYTIPVADVRKEGCKCYVVIAHFADGTSQMSQIWSF